MLILLLALTVTPGAALPPAGAQQKPKVELFQPAEAAEAVASTTVGMRVRVEELAIPGTDLRAKPVADPGRADVIVRVINVFPHGSARRYNIEVTPQVEGDFDLRDHLERADGSSMENVPELRITVDAVNAADLAEEGVPAMPNPLKVPAPGYVGGYGDLLKAGAVLWVLGLLALVFAGRNKRADLAAGAGAAPLTLADRLRPLVERASQGDLPSGERAELERLVLAHWRGRRDLEGVPVGEAVSRLRQDPEAGPLLQRMEQWFHRPASSEPSEAEIAELLAPYRSVSAHGAPSPGDAGPVQRPARAAALPGSEAPR